VAALALLVGPPERLLPTGANGDAWSARLARAWHAPVADAAASTPAAASPAGSAALPPLAPITADELMSRARGGATVVNLWATYCVPCRQELPALLRVAKAHRKDGLRLMLVSVDFDEQRLNARRFLAAQGFRDTSFIKTGNDQAFINGVEPEWSGALPATLIFDRAGRRIAFWEGAADEHRFEHMVTQALATNRR
jgi:thiol-disulfide isomerase/thioredoxin